MIPRWHIILGGIFTLILWAFSPSVNPVYLGLVFFSSFLIDFDHYMSAALKLKTINLKKVLEYHDVLGKKEMLEKRKGIRRKCPHFHVFHTIEFHLFIGLLSFVWIGFFYIFLGMVFHSLLDLTDLAQRGVIYRREYFLVNWLFNKE